MIGVAGRVIATGFWSYFRGAFAEALGGVVAEIVLREYKRRIKKVKPSKPRASPVRRRSRRRRNAH